MEKTLDTNTPALTPEQVEKQIDETWDQLATERQGGSDAGLADDVDVLTPSTPKAETPLEAKPQPAVPAPPTAREMMDALTRSNQALAELRANQQAMQGQLQTASGRVSALQSQLAKVPKTETPTESQTAAALKSPAKWAKMKEEFPEWSEAFEDFVRENMPAAKEAGQPAFDLDAVKTEIRTDLSKESFEREFKYVSRKIPNWTQKINTPEFGTWLQSQPPEVKALAESDYALDALELLDHFDKREQPTQQESNDPVTAQRNARLRTAVTARPGKATTPKDPRDMTEDEIWQAESEKRERQRAAGLR
jgi:hypothetical protein